MTVEDFRKEIEKIILDLDSSGFETIDMSVVEKLGKLSRAAEELGMKEGKHMIDNLSDAMKAIAEGKSQAESGNIRLTALDFYVKKISAGASTEEL